HDIVPASVKEFYKLNKTQQTNRSDFESILTKNSPKNIDWFFETIIDSREIIDYKFSNVSRTKDSVQFSINNRTGIYAPIPIYGIKKNQIVFKEWIEPKNNDSDIILTEKMRIKLLLIMIMRFRNTIRETTGNH
ncbi:aminopeptidase, partial [Flavobacterium sp. LBUM151]